MRSWAGGCNDSFGFVIDAERNIAQCISEATLQELPVCPPPAHIHLPWDEGTGLRISLEIRLHPLTRDSKLAIKAAAACLYSSESQVGAKIQVGQRKALKS